MAPTVSSVLAFRHRTAPRILQDTTRLQWEKLFVKGVELPTEGGGDFNITGIVPVLSWLMNNGNQKDVLVTE